MERDGRIMRFKVVFVGLFFMVLLCGCAQTKMQLGAIPSPTATNKLRVVVYPVSEMTHFNIPYHEYVKNQYRNCARFLDKSGIYDVVPFNDFQAVVGDERQVGWKIRNGDWGLAMQIAKALYADYIFIMERGFHSRNAFFLKFTLVNAENGKRFAYHGVGAAGQTDEVMHVLRAGYRNIFNEAKNDMLANAIRKGKASQQQDSNESASLVREATSRDTVKETAAMPKQKTPSSSSQDKEAQVIGKAAIEKDLLEKALSQNITETGKSNIVVYDFHSSKNLNVVALILTEALREEIFRLGSFNLVDRENLTQVMDELKLQQSGFVDENNAVEIGKWLAANETVTGRLEVLGNTYALFAKRTDIKSLSTIGIGSLKCLKGEEEELLNGMPALAKKLTGK